ncbi:hypothetical protein AHF37_11893 [Paragonimus kellicotti]|nr:hypothetical protein AHF37_11893 [Paragonimus kellicotti]
MADRQPRYGRGARYARARANVCHLVIDHRRCPQHICQRGIAVPYRCINAKYLVINPLGLTINCRSFGKCEANAQVPFNSKQFRVSSSTEHVRIYASNSLLKFQTFYLRQPAFRCEVL